MYALPSLENFKKHMMKLKIKKDDEIICYDVMGMFWVAKVAWMLRYFGATNVKILNGGLRKWMFEGRKVMVLDEEEANINNDQEEEDSDDYLYSINDSNLILNDK